MLGRASYHARVLDRLRRTFALDRPIWPSLLVIAVAVGFGLPLVRRGLVLSDEGYLLQQALDLLNGHVLYRDLDAFITPGAWFLLAGTFAIFEPSVIASRLPMLIAYAALCLTGYRIVAPISGRAYGFGAVASLLAFSVWAFPAWTFAFYSPLAVLFALLALERLLEWQRTRRMRDLLWLGVWLGASICFKQNYGLLALIGAAIAWLVTQDDGSDAHPKSASASAREAGVVALGVLAAGLPFFFYLLFQGALPEAWYSLVVHPFEFGGKHDIPFAPLSELWRADLYSDGTEKLTYLSYAHLRAGPIALLQAVRGTHRLHVLAYWLPLLIFAAGLFAAIVGGRRAGRRIDAPLFAVVCVGGFVFLGVWPRADFNHLVNVYQPVLIAAAVVLQRTRALIPETARMARAALASLVALLALLYGGTALVWYRVLLQTHAFPVEGPRGGVLVDLIDAGRIADLMRIIETEVLPGAALLTLPDLTMLNFLTDHPVPSAYYNLYEHHIARDGGAAVVEGVERNHVEVAITRFDNFFSDRVGLLDYAPVLAEHLVTHFAREQIGPDQDYIVYRRRPEPLAIAPFVDVLQDCRAEEETNVVLDHLLFSTLYHRSTALVPIPPQGLATHCRVHVPDAGGVLSLELGYLRPAAVMPGTQIVAEISVLDDDDRRRIHYETVRVVPIQGARRQQPFRRVDLPLDRWAGRDVEIEFRTRLLGHVAMHPLDLKGFAMTYRDVRVQESAEGARP